jgi:hypothetical protein
MRPISSLFSALLLPALALASAPSLAAQPECAAPDPGGARFIAISVDRPGLTTDVALGEDPARAVEIRLAPGRERLALAVWSRGGPTVWRVTGARERLDFVYVGGDHAAADGVEAARVVFEPVPGCLDFLERASRDELPNDLGPPKPGELMGANPFGRAPERMMILPFAAALDPEGPLRQDVRALNVVETPRDGPAAALWREADMRGPLTLVPVETLVAAAPAKKLAVLPGYAGLAQLVEMGAIEIAGVETPRPVALDDPIARALAEAMKNVRGVSVSVEEVGPGGPARAKARAQKPTPNAFLIREAIAMPAHPPHARWLLAQGAPPPQGDLSGLCVLRQMSEEPVAGSACPKPMRAVPK